MGRGVGGSCGRLISLVWGMEGHGSSIPASTSTGFSRVAALDSLFHSHAHDRVSHTNPVHLVAQSPRRYTHASPRAVISRAGNFVNADSAQSTRTYDMRFLTPSTEKSCSHSTLPFIAVPPYVDIHRHQYPIKLLPRNSQDSQGPEPIEDPGRQRRKLVLVQFPACFRGRQQAGVEQKGRA